MIQELLRFSSLNELLSARRDAQGETRFLAGGTEINRLQGNERGRSLTCLSLEGLGLDGIEQQSEGLHIGATVTLQKLIDHADVPDYLKEAAAFAGSRTLRNMATVGGNIGAYRDDSYLVPTLIAAKARIITAELGEQGRIEQENVPIREFIENFEEFRNCCIIGISLNKRGRCVMTRRYARARQRRSDAVIAFGADCSSGNFTDVRTAVAAMGIGITRLVEVDRAVEDQSLRSDRDFRELVERVLHPQADSSGSAAYKQYLTAVTLSDMIRTCRERIERSEC